MGIQIKTKKIEKEKFCKGNCGNKARYSGWCGFRWKKDNKISVKCPTIEKKRGASISRYRKEESKLGLNPMQNPKICKKNHSKERNKKAAETLKALGEKKLLPQQTESKELREKRLQRIRLKLQQLSKENKLNHQVESEWKRKRRYKRISNTLKEKFRMGLIELPKPITPVYNSTRNGITKLRSSWELEVAKFLDDLCFKWAYEPTKIEYWNSEKKENRTTIPDFFLPDYNLFIEVKGMRKDFNLQKITNDKLKGIQKNGFNVLLWKEEEINLIKKNNFEPLLEQINNFEVKINA